MRDHRTRHPTLRVDLTLPSTKLGFGPLAYDPLKEALGIDPHAALAPLLCGQPHIRTAGRAAVEVFPLAIAPDTRMAIPLGVFGQFAVANDRGLLALTLPVQAIRWLQSQVDGLLVEGPMPITDDDGVHRASVVWLRLTPGMRVGLPLGLFGELGLEAA